MRTLFLAGLLIALLATVQISKAQQETPNAELYGGFSYIRFNINANLPGVAPSATYNGYGGGAQFEYNGNRWLGAVADVAGYGATNTTHGTLVGGAVTYLFGPRINFRCGKVAPFAQTLFGGIGTTSGLGQSGVQNNFAMTAGGGTLEYRATSRFVRCRPSTS